MGITGVGWDVVEGVGPVVFDGGGKRRRLYEACRGWMNWEGVRRKRRRG